MSVQQGHPQEDEARAVSQHPCPHLGKPIGVSVASDVRAVFPILRMDP